MGRQDFGQQGTPPGLGQVICKGAVIITTVTSPQIGGKHLALAAEGLQVVLAQRRLG